MAEESVQSLKAGGQTFVIEIKCVQNQTWQGVVTWVQTQQKVSFRSALELIKLLDSAVGEGDLPVNDWNGGQLQE